MMSKQIYCCIPLIFFLFLFGFKEEVFAQKDLSTIKITFSNVVKNAPLELYDATYTNSFGEDYTINKFRFYISNIILQNKNQSAHKDSSIFLIDEARKESKSITLMIPSGEYSSLSFQIGVDSIYNVSGAQTGALDPTKDMFWTWHTGYVMAKLEGISPASTVVNGKYEFHIGGFSGKFNVLKNKTLLFPENKTLRFEPGKTVEITIKADVDTWFQNPNEMRIADKPAINSPGKYALAISENYMNMFAIEKIVHLP
ncbi:MAG: MbnP family protein [Ginsengibacter sp.]